MAAMFVGSLGQSMVDPVYLPLTLEVLPFRSFWHLKAWNWFRGSFSGVKPAASCLPAFFF
jgi:hypothetical protein